MKVAVEFDFDQCQEIVVAFMKDSLDTALRFDASEYEIKSYLYVLADHMYIGDFRKYAQEKNLENYCEEIYERYKGLNLD